MNIYVDRDRLPSGLSYPLKRSYLDKALFEGGIRSVFRIDYCRIPYDMRSMFRCGHDDWWGLWKMESTDLRRSSSEKSVLVAATVFRIDDPYSRDCECAISVNSIASARRHKAEAIFVDHGLSKLVEWISNAEAHASDATWRFMDHHFAFALTDDDDWYVLKD